MKETGIIQLYLLLRQFSVVIGESWQKDMREAELLSREERSDQRE